MIFAIYLMIAAIVVLFSIKCADYVDMLDKKTNISGAFIGGVILAAVTSLPELVTSISAIAIKNHGLIIGNVLGSDIFNLCIFGGLVLLTPVGFAKAKVGSSHKMTLLCTIAAYVVTGFVLFNNGAGSIPGVSINIASVVIVILYALSCKFMASDSEQNDNEDDNDLTIKQVVTRFVICAAGLVISSVAITYVTNIIDARYNLGASLAGALFLGVATSIPELTSSISLVRKRNYNAMVGNVLGSNMFNYIIFSLADIVAFSTDIYEQQPQALSDSKLLIVLGLVSTIAALTTLLVKKRSGAKSSKNYHYLIFALFGAVIIASYIAFLILSMTNA